MSTKFLINKSMRLHKHTQAAAEWRVDEAFERFFFRLILFLTGATLGLHPNTSSGLPDLQSVIYADCQPVDVLMLSAVQDATCPAHNQL